MKRSLQRLPEPLRLVSRRVRSDLSHRWVEASRQLRGHPMGPESILMIFGCQRSGTTMMTEVFNRDPDAKVFGEYSVLSASDQRNHLRLASLDRVASHLEKSRFPLVVLKPLVESQRADELLAAIPQARALWLVRDPWDVARSNLNRFGEDNGIRNLERLLAARSGDWRGERVPERVRQVIEQHYSASMEPMDAAALFWWARNALFFDLGLHERPDVLPVRYESLVTRPAETLSEIYTFIGRTFPGSTLMKDIFAGSVGRSKASQLSEPVRALCLPTLERFDSLISARSTCE